MPTNLTDAATFDATVQAPADADPHRGSAYELGMQQLANRTRNLANRLGGADGSGEHTYLDAAGDPAPKTRTIVISVANGRSYTPVAGPDWDDAAGFSVVSTVNFANFFFDITPYIPTGAILQAVDVVVNPGAARSGTNRMLLDIRRLNHDFATPAAPANTSLGSTRDDSTTNIQTITVGSLAFTSDRTDLSVIAQVVGGHDAGSNVDAIHSLRITFTDPGPRNG